MTEALRIFIGLGALSAIVLIIKVNHPYRKILSNDHILSRAGVGVLLLGIAYGVGESQYLGLPFGPRLVVIAIGIAWLNLGVLNTIYREKRRGRDPRIPPGL